MDARRRVLVLGSACAALLGWPALGLAKTRALALDAFLDLSARLCERPRERLDRAMAQRIFEALELGRQSTALRALRRHSTSHPVLAARLRAAWFSGEVATAEGTVLVGFEDALVWDSAPFLHVPGQCGGATGHWAELPAQSA